MLYAGIDMMDDINSIRASFGMGDNFALNCGNDRRES